MQLLNKKMQSTPTVFVTTARGKKKNHEGNLVNKDGEIYLIVREMVSRILPQSAVADWIDPEGKPAAILELALTDMKIEKVV